MWTVILVAMTDRGPVVVEELDGVLVEVATGAFVDPATVELRGFERAPASSSPTSSVA